MGRCECNTSAETDSGKVTSYNLRFIQGTGLYRAWGRHCATSWRVSGSIPGGVAGIFSEATDGTIYPRVNSASKN
jgi:hypothetical protein